MQGLHPSTSQLAWGLFVSGPPQTPLLDPKPENLKTVREEGGDGLVLAVFRRLLHNHMLYVILCDPVLAHLMRRVGEFDWKHTSVRQLRRFGVQRVGVETLCTLGGQDG